MESFFLIIFDLRNKNINYLLSILKIEALNLTKFVHFFNICLNHPKITLEKIGESYINIFNTHLSNDRRKILL